LATVAQVLPYAPDVLAWHRPWGAAASGGGKQQAVASHSHKRFAHADGNAELLTRTMDLRAEEPTNLIVASGQARLLCRRVLTVGRYSRHVNQLKLAAQRRGCSSS